MTFPPDCESSVQGATTCLHEAAKAGEAVYIEYCQNRLTLGNDIAGLASRKNWQERTAIIKMLDMARSAYEAERKFIDAEMDRLKPYCQTKNWSGKVTISYRVKTNSSTPWPGTAMTGKTDVDGQDMGEATITVMDGKAYGELSIGYNFKKTTFASGERQCGKNKKGTATVNQVQTVEKQGDFYSRPSFKVNVDSHGAFLVEGFIKGGYGMRIDKNEDNNIDPCGG